jgi:hypothetical protein
MIHSKVAMSMLVRGPKAVAFTGSSGVDVRGIFRSGLKKSEMGPAPRTVEASSPPDFRREWPGVSVCHIGVRLDGDVAKDMIAMRIAPDMRTTVVGSPDYFERHSLPNRPEDLTEHDCIGRRLPTHGGLMTGEFKRRGKTLNAHVCGRLVFTTSDMILVAALGGHGLAWLPEDLVRECWPYRNSAPQKVLSWESRPGRPQSGWNTGYSTLRGSQFSPRGQCDGFRLTSSSFDQVITRS